MFTIFPCSAAIVFSFELFHPANPQAGSSSPSLGQIYLVWTQALIATNATLCQQILDLLNKDEKQEKRMYRARRAVQILTAELLEREDNPELEVKELLRATRL